MNSKISFNSELLSSHPVSVRLLDRFRPATEMLRWTSFMTAGNTTFDRETHLCTCRMLAFGVWRTTRSR